MGPEIKGKIFMVASHVKTCELKSLTEGRNEKGDGQKRKMEVEEEEQRGVWWWQ